MDDFLKELQETFLLESQDLLANVESLFLQLEKNSTDLEVYNQLSRLAHNFKGSGKAVGFDHISHFSHQLENLLLACKSQAVVPTPAVINLLFRSVDALKLDLENLRAGGPIADYAHLLGEIELALKNEHAPAAPLIAENLNFEPPHAAVANAGAHPKKTVVAEYLRIPAARIEALIDAFGEQVILQSSLDQSKNDLQKNEDLVMKTISQLSKLTYDLQQTAMSLRMVGLNLLFSKLERAARDAAQSLEKPISFVTKGNEQELDKTIVDSLSDALTHMVRNAVDHGIETREERLAAGKDPEGQITLEAYRAGGSFVIEVRDDGRGMDPEKILAKAIRSGIVKENAKLSKKDIFDLIFENGFSIKETATDISGRGVGMNVVKEKIIELKGSYEIDSKLGAGSIFRIHLPLTLAIFNGMIVRVGAEKFIIPNSDVDEVSRINVSKLKAGSGTQNLIEIRDQVYSIIDLRKELFRKPVEGRNSQVTALLVRKSRQAVALLVDEVLSIQKIVHKAVGTDVKVVRGSAGASILGDGSVCLILNISHFTPNVVEKRNTQEAA